jgi:(p)ppGpp synthase/HD superfamily hydrolase
MSDEQPFVPYGPRFEEALLYAARVHAVQRRKGTAIPYVTHLLAVAAIVGENGGTEDEVIAALLHDAVEDQGGEARLADIRARFGVEVAAIVWGCTDAETIPKPPWRARKEAYIAHLAGATPSVLLVSSADKLHNARAILADLRAQGAATWGRFNGGKEGSLWYYRALAAAYARREGGPVAEELARVVGEIERLA